MRQYNLTINNNNYEVTIRSITFESATVEVDGSLYHVNINAIKNIIPQNVAKQAEQYRQINLSNNKQSSGQQHQTINTSCNNNVGTNNNTQNSSTANTNNNFQGSQEIIAGKAVIAPIPGQIRHLCVNVGDIVSEGQGILVMEAMKMENTISTMYAGRVAKILVNVGDSVGQDQKLLIIES